MPSDVVTVSDPNIKGFRREARLCKCFLVILPSLPLVDSAEASVLQADIEFYQLVHVSLQFY